MTVNNHNSEGGGWQWDSQLRPVDFALKYLQLNWSVFPGYSPQVQTRARRICTATCHGPSSRREDPPRPRSGAGIENGPTVECS